MLEANPIGIAIKKRLLELKALKKTVVASLSKAPKGILRVEGKYHYYMVDGQKRIYLRSNQRPLVKALAKRDYDEKLLVFLEERIKELQAFSERKDIDSVYDSFSDSRKELFSAYTMNDKFVEAWQNEPYERWDDGHLEAVRSKSEELIANFLIHEGIPFKYEMKCDFPEGSARPDFTCLNRRTGRSIIWEHFGMMDDQEYASKTVKKIRNYSSIGYVQGINLIMTFETKECPFTTKYLHQFLPILT